MIGRAGLLGVLCVLSALSADAAAAEFASTWENSVDGPWLGKDYWVNPLQDFVLYRQRVKAGDEVAYYEGVIRSEPTRQRTLTLGALSCHLDFGFPHNELVRNVQRAAPDLLVFSGDQIYEGNGDYGLQREPHDAATLDYLRKWYLFGWAFRDLLRDRPSALLVDDHDVFQGNVWGAGGKRVANFWPRRWFPPVAGANASPGAPRYTGDFNNGFGNKITIYAGRDRRSSATQFFSRCSSLWAAWRRCCGGRTRSANASQARPLRHPLRQP